MSDTTIRHVIFAGRATAGTVALMLAPRIANADRHHGPRCHPGYEGPAPPPEKSSDAEPDENSHASSKVEREICAP